MHVYVLRIVGQYAELGTGCAGRGEPAGVAQLASVAAPLALTLARRTTHTALSIIYDPIQHITPLCHLVTAFKGNVGRDSLN